MQLLKNFFKMLGKKNQSYFIKPRDSKIVRDGCQILFLKLGEYKRTT